MVMGSKYEGILDLAASRAIILDWDWNGKSVKSGLDSNVVMSLIENCNVQ